MSNYGKSGQKWTKEEEDQLWNEVKLGRTFSVIGKNHNRSELAIHLRFASIVQEKLKKNISMRTICNEVNLKESSIRNILDKASNYTNNKQSTSLSSSSSSGGFHNETLLKKINDLETKMDLILEKIKNTEKYVKSIHKKLS